MAGSLLAGNSVRPAGITASAYFVPDTRLTHSTLSERYGAEVMDRIAESTGIIERRVVSSTTCASDLAVRAAEDLFAATGIDRGSIDLVTFASQTPDYLLPTTACLIQDRLHLPTACAAFDVNLGCSQYLYSLAVANAMVTSGLVKRALVLTGDTVSRILNPADRSVVPLFGDAGTAAIVEAVDDGEGFSHWDFGTDGSGGPSLIWPASGLRIRRSPETSQAETDKYQCVRSKEDMFMDGSAIFMFTLSVVPKSVNALLARADLAVDDVDLFVFHQASKLIVDSAARKLKIPHEKIHLKFAEYGNSGGSTVGVALTDAWLKGRLKPGMRVVLSAFGVGLSWCSTLLTWPAETHGAVYTGT
jgi:3-oxoacyl-[acyl-carrier-protein] synthase III